MLPGDVTSRDYQVVLRGDSHRIPKKVISCGAHIEALLCFGLRLFNSLDFVIASFEE